MGCRSSGSLPKLTIGWRSSGGLPQLTTVCRSSGRLPKLTTVCRRIGSLPQLTMDGRSFDELPELRCAAEGSATGRSFGGRRLGLVEGLERRGTTARRAGELGGGGAGCPRYEGRSFSQRTARGWKPKAAGAASRRTRDLGSASRRRRRARPKWRGRGQSAAGRSGGRGEDLAPAQRGSPRKRGGRPARPRARRGEAPGG